MPAPARDLELRIVEAVDLKDQLESFVGSFGEFLRMMRSTRAAEPSTHRAAASTRVASLYPPVMTRPGNQTRSVATSFGAWPKLHAIDGAARAERK